jgi:hypothetical protein
MATKKKQTEATPSEATPSETTEARQAPSEPGLEPGSTVITMPKFNPYDRPVSTEQVSATPLRQSYEEIRDTAKGSGVDEWREVDRARAELGQLYLNLKEDARYSEEYKAETAWRQYQFAREKAERLAPEAREKMLRSADGLERQSIPMPAEQGLVTKDVDKLMLTAHERNRLERLVERKEKVGSGPFKADPMATLASEYERALSQGGPGGGATCRAIVELCRDYGYDVDQIVDKHRKHYHHGALQDAEQNRMRARMVSRSVPRPPFPHPEELKQTPGRVGAYGRGARATVPQQKGTLFKKNRRPSWK